MALLPLSKASSGSFYGFHWDGSHSRAESTQEGKIGRLSSSSPRGWEGRKEGTDRLSVGERGVGTVV